MIELRWLLTTGILNTSMILRELLKKPLTFIIEN